MTLAPLCHASEELRNPYSFLLMTLAVSAAVLTVGVLMLASRIIPPVAPVVVGVSLMDCKTIT